MKNLFKKLNSNRGFTLLEALITTVLVAVAASMSISVFMVNAKINSTQQSINNQQNSALRIAEKSLASEANPDYSMVYYMKQNGKNELSEALGGTADTLLVSAGFSGERGQVRYMYFKPYKGEQLPESSLEITQGDIDGAMRSAKNYPVNSDNSDWKEYFSSYFRGSKGSGMSESDWSEEWEKHWNLKRGAYNYPLEEAYGDDYNNYWGALRAYLAANGNAVGWKDYWQAGAEESTATTVTEASTETTSAESTTQVTTQATTETTTKAETTETTTKAKEKPEAEPGTEPDSEGQV